MVEATPPHVVVKSCLADTLDKSSQIAPRPYPSLANNKSGTTKLASSPFQDVQPTADHVSPTSRIFAAFPLAQRFNLLLHMEIIVQPISLHYPFSYKTSLTSCTIHPPWRLGEVVQPCPTPLVQGKKGSKHLMPRLVHRQLDYVVPASCSHTKSYSPRNSCHRACLRDSFFVS
ncbi:unnamed protein product [Dovyalis caffra]|uniref:Uncharacterized protein n=1 Tax=Dovyalis caffra TaxID=77055 RepID=A0AAV1QXP1_9ROSI|nr:unnamed protein product [Dovyalis caffra]